MTFIKDTAKPVIILIFFMVLTCLCFWIISRYPELSAKTILGSNSILSSLGFVALIEIKEEFSFWEKVLWETVNWLNTNKKGMSFSFILGAFILSLWPLLKKQKFDNGFKNSVLGLSIGAPLGICVNCAAPIARALYSSGGSIQTALSALIASPTLNIAILLMAFSLFPFYLFLIKIVLTLLFILVLVPLACRYLFQKEIIKHEVLVKNTLDIPQNVDPISNIRGWSDAFLWAGKRYLKSFFYLLKIALPLMILSGFLGSLIIVIAPWSMIQGLGNDMSFLSMALIMFLFSVLGAILPAPMAFDIILSSALLQAGVPIQYVAILLFTLGSFSLYAFFIIWQAMSLRISMFLLLTTIILGLCAGFLTIPLEQYTMFKAQNEIALFIDQVRQSQYNSGQQQIDLEDQKTDEILERNDKEYALDELKKILKEQSVLFEVLPNKYIAQKSSHIQIKWRRFEKNGQHSAQQNFSLIQGSQMGIEQPYQISYLSGIPDAVVFSTMSIATADVHHDGWPDILITGDHEIRPNLILYSNIGGQYFVRQSLPIPENIKEVVLVALVDLNGDSWKDIVFSTYGGKNFVIYNHGGDFLKSNLHQIHSDNIGTTMTMAFGDLGKDGDLDMFWGNWNVGPLFLDFKQSQNVVLYNDGSDFRAHKLPKTAGETLTSLFYDFNNDGVLDLYIGNDFIVESHSDILMIGDENGDLTLGNIEFIQGGQSTMSIDVGDIDNDLKPDFYIGQISYSGQYMQEMSKIAEKQIPYNQYCNRPEAINSSSDICIEDFILKLSLAKVAHHISDACNAVQNTEHKIKCLTSLTNSCGFRRTPRSQSNPLYGSKRYNDFCGLLSKAMDEDSQVSDDGNKSFYLQAANDSLNNILLHNISENNNIMFMDQANERNVGYGAWTWNARFADLDNDGWQDLYIVNGYSFPMSLPTNLFYHNDQNGSFKDKTTEFGLENYTVTSAFSYIDFDNDGDLDIINVPTDAGIQIYRNNNVSRNHSIQFELNDHSAQNSGAVGVKIIISYKKNGQAFKQESVLKGGGGFKSYNQPILHFGLETVDEIQVIDIIWPDGGKDQIKGTFPANRRYRIIRSGTRDGPRN